MAQYLLLNSGMIELHLVLHTPRHQTRPVIAAFQSLARWARAEPGCLSARLFVTVGDPHCVCYIEAWESEEELRRMIRSPHFSQLATLMELANDAPECEFRVVAETRGLEFATQVRDCLGDREGIAVLQEQAASARLEGEDSV